jgi:drug/metabolite transporter (DMT)-like permease
MWQLYCIGSLFCGTLEETIDKANMVGHKSIGLLSATWIRNIIFLIITVLGSLVISAKLPSFVFTSPIIVLGILYAINSILYTVLLKQIEITTSSIMSNFIPLTFLPIDMFIIGKAFLSRQIFGIIFLVVGGLVFFLRRKNITSVISKRQAGIITIVFLFNTLLFGLESYLFRDLFDTVNLSESSFLASVWGVTLIFLSLLVIGKYFVTRRDKFHFQEVVKYSRSSILSKIADFGNSFLFLKALTLSSTSQVSAMQSFYPIVLVLVVLIAQKKLHVNLEELLDRKTLKSKLLGIIIICLGTILIR